MNWTYNQELDTYLCGEENNGCGVCFFEENWTGMVVYKNVMLVMLGNYGTKEEGQEAAEKEYNRIAELHS